MLSSDGSSSKLALFEGEPRGNRPTAGHHRVAFRVDGDAFVRFLNREDGLEIFDDDGHPIHSKEAVDHGQAFSIYFCDPYGNRYEITTYDYESVQSQIAS